MGGGQGLKQVVEIASYWPKFKRLRPGNCPFCRMRAEAWAIGLPLFSEGFGSLLAP